MIQFDEQGNMNHFPRVYVVEGGKLEQLEWDQAKRRLLSLERGMGTAMGPVAIQARP